MSSLESVHEQMEHFVVFGQIENTSHKSNVTSPAKKTDHSAYYQAERKMPPRQIQCFTGRTRVSDVSSSTNLKPFSEIDDIFRIMHF